MAILNQFGAPFPSAGPERTFYRSASRDAQSLWTTDRLDDIDALLPSYDHATLLSGSRNMFANFGPCRAAIFQKANTSVGQAYLPDYIGQNPDWGRAARDWLIGDFYPIADVRGAPYHFRQTLWLDSVALDRDGDFFILLTSHSQSGLPATQHIPANRCCTGPHDNDGEPVKKGPYRGAKICNGVIKNRQGRSVAYRFRLGDGWEPRDFTDISARDVRHAFDPEWHDQSRGIPAGAHALRMLRQSLQSHEWEHVALMMLSSIGLIERNPLGAADPDDPGNTLGDDATTAATGDPGLVTQSYAGGTVRYFASSDPHSGIEAINGDRPDQQWERFQDRTIRFYCEGCPWPYELTWKPGELNGVMVRSIQQRANQIALDRQGVLDGIAGSVISYALYSAGRLGLIPEAPSGADLRAWKFRHPPKISIDPGRDTAATIAAIDADVETLKDHVESTGSTLQEHFAKIKEADDIRRQILGPAPLEDPAS